MAAALSPAGSSVVVGVCGSGGGGGGGGGGGAVGAGARQWTELHVAKQDFKFSAAHFIVHERSRERLHGHNYGVAVDVRGRMPAGGSGGSGYLVDFAKVKRAVRDVCAALDERFLCPAASPHLAVALDAAAGELTLVARCDGARFVLPAADAVLLPCANITVEALAAELAARIVAHSELAAHVGVEISHVSVAVTETPGQEARYTLQLGSGCAAGAAQSAPAGKAAGAL